MEYKESELRDLLADNLGLIESGLKLIKVEYAILITDEDGGKNSGYIDILARDRDGRFVIIELKKSKQSSRSAIHEVYKYLDALALEKTLNYADIRILIVSTEWKELSLSFQVAHQNKNINIEGYRVILAETEKLQIQSIQKVELHKAIPQRLFGNFSLIAFFYNHDDAQKMLVQYDALYKFAGINNYVLIYFENKNRSISSPYQVAIYIVEPLQDESVYRKLFTFSEQYKNDKEIYKKDIQTIHFEAMDVLHGIIQWDYFPNIYQDSLEMGSRSKIRELLLSKDWETTDVFFGKKMDSTDYVIKEIIKELSGNVSCFAIQTEDNFSSDNIAAASQKSKKLFDILKVVPRWQDFFHNVLYSLQQSEEKYNCFYRLCLEERIIPLLTKVARNDFHEPFALPNIEMQIDYQNRAEVYIGFLQCRKYRGECLKDILNKYYPCNDFHTYLHWAWGKYSQTDSYIAEDLNIHFEIAKLVEWKNDGQQEYFKYSDAGFRKISSLEYDCLFSFTLDSELQAQLTLI